MSRTYAEKLVAHQKWVAGLKPGDRVAISKSRLGMDSRERYDIKTVVKVTRSHGGTILVGDGLDHEGNPRMARFDMDGDERGDLDYRSRRKIQEVTPEVLEANRRYAAATEVERFFSQRSATDALRTEVLEQILALVKGG